MKKYVKPDVYFEDFKLSQHIATCDFDMSNSKSKEECSALMYDNTTYLFISGNNTCTYTGTNEDYCYTNGADGITVFNS